MNEKFHTLRIRRSYFTIGQAVLLCVVCVVLLVRTVEARGGLAFVFLLGAGTLAGFFLSLLYFFSPYLRVDDDRIIIHHDLLRKDVVFFYDIHDINFEDKSFVGINHLNGLSRVVFRKFNAHDKKLVLDFFTELQEEKK